MYTSPYATNLFSIVFFVQLPLYPLHYLFPIMATYQGISKAHGPFLLQARGAE